MAIDDPVGITIRQAEEEVTAESYLPARLLKLGFSAVAAGALVAMPAIAQIITSLLGNHSGRLEKRLLRVCEELNSQQKRIEDKIPNRSYYESEEFQTLMGIVIEKLHSTHDENKLRMFGAALANCGSSEFQSIDRELYLRTLRELSATDITVLTDQRLTGWTPHIREIQYDAEILSILSRLVGMGLVTEHFEARTPTIGVSGSERIDVVNIMRDLITKPPKRTYALSPFGARFLKFIAQGTIES